MDAAIASGRGVLVVEPQTSCIDAMIWRVSRRWAVSAVTGLKGDTRPERWINKRRECGLQTVYGTDQLRPVMRALKRGEVIWMSPDVPIPVERGGVRTHYFGQRAMPSSAPARLAAMTGASVLSLSPVRSDCGARYRLCFHPIASCGPDPVTATQQLAYHLEQLVSLHPEQYLWSARRFELRRGTGLRDQSLRSVPVR